MELQELKTSVSDLAKLFSEFRETHTKSIKDGDVLLEEKMNRVADDFGKKLDAMQKAQDELRAIAAKPSIVETEASRKEAEEALELKKLSLIARKQFDPDAKLDASVEEFREYKRAFNQYLRKDAAKLSPEAYKALSVGDDADGGYLVLPAMSSRIMTQIYESSPMRSLATIETISTDSLEITTDIDEAGAGWVGERETRSETTTPQIAKKSIPVHEIYAEPRATAKLLEDASVDMERWLVNKVRNKFGRTEATAFVSGNGVGKPRGFLTYSAGTSWGQIQQVNSGSASALAPDGLIECKAALKEEYQSNATWLMRRATIGDVMKLKANNEYIFTMVFVNGFAANLLGHPVRFAADMDAVGANALAVAFGDWSTAYTIVDRIGISVLRDPYTTKGFVKFYTRMRVGGDVTNFEAIKIQKCST